MHPFKRMWSIPPNNFHLWSSFTSDIVFPCKLRFFINISKNTINLIKIAKPNDKNINIGISNKEGEDFYYQSSHINQANSFKAYENVKKVKIQISTLNKIIKDLDRNIRSVNIFDVFEGGNLSPDKKSIAINVSLQADDRTLSDSDLNHISEKIIKEVENKTGGNIRS